MRPVRMSRCRHRGTADPGGHRACRASRDLPGPGGGRAFTTLGELLRPDDEEVLALADFDEEQ